MYAWVFVKHLQVVSVVVVVVAQGCRVSFLRHTVRHYYHRVFCPTMMMIIIIITTVLGLGPNSRGTGRLLANGGYIMERNNGQASGESPHFPSKALSVSPSLAESFKKSSSCLSQEYIIGLQP